MIIQHLTEKVNHFQSGAIAEPIFRLRTHKIIFFWRGEGNHFPCQGSLRGLKPPAQDVRAALSRAEREGCEAETTQPILSKAKGGVISKVAEATSAIGSAPTGSKGRPSSIISKGKILPCF